MKVYPAMRSPFMLFMVACERRSGVAQETAWLSPGILSKDEVAAQAATWTLASMIAMACQSKKSSWRIQYTEFKAARTAARAQHSARNK